MRQFICLLATIFVVGTSHALMGQDVKVDLAVLDTGEVIVKAPSILDTVVVDSLLEVSVNQSGTVELELLHEETSHGLIKFDVNSVGEISNVEWKSDKSDTTEYQDLDTARYELSGSDKEIKFKGCQVALDLSGSDVNSYQLNYYDPVARDYSFLTEVSGNTGYELFPGNYLLTSIDNGTSIGFLLRDDCYVDANATWDDVDDDEPDPKHLHIEAYEVGLNLFRVKGASLTAKFHIGSDNSAMIVGLSSEAAALEDNVGKQLKLMPGTYQVAFSSGPEVQSLLEFKVLNGTHRLSPQMRWKDVVGSRTSGEFVPLEAGWVYLTPESMEGASEPPFEQADAVLPYAVLKEKLDAGYYIARSEELKVRYDERYNESADLRFRILDQNNMEVTLANPVPRTYGTNWITFPLPAGQFTVGQYYVLEVRSEKGDLSMLRFRYD